MTMNKRLCTAVELDGLFFNFSNDSRVKMLIYNFQMGGDPQREGPGGNKNMINIPIKIEIHQDNNHKTGANMANKVTFSENSEVSFVR